jgi:uncharacterized protein (DUF488 family)
MFYRRKVIMALLQSFGGNLEKISLQKLLFLYSTKQEKPSYDFIPYHYGSYSISAHADLEAMTRQHLIEKDEKNYKKKDKSDYIKSLNFDDRIVLQKIISEFANKNSTDLMKFTYLNFNYYAINSKAAPNLLSEIEYEKIKNAKPTNDKTILFTIGYEGISLEEYLNRLIKNDVKMLVDVRCNPVSMKFGFSKNQIKLHCENLRIEYIHIPEVGIRSEFRQDLKSQLDYDELFNVYKSETLKKTGNHQENILELLKSKKRIALTCFEADICKCHRSHLAKSITKLPEWGFELKHL